MNTSPLTLVKYLCLLSSLPHFKYSSSVPYTSATSLLQPVPPETERPLGAGRLGLSHWAGPSVTGSARWSQSWYRGIIVDILAKESKFP